MIKLIQLQLLILLLFVLLLILHKIIMERTGARSLKDGTHVHHFRCQCELTERRCVSSFKSTRHSLSLLSLPFPQSTTSSSSSTAWRIATRPSGSYRRNATTCLRFPNEISDDTVGWGNSPITLTALSSTRFLWGPLPLNSIRRAKLPEGCSVTPETTMHHIQCLKGSWWQS